MQNFSIIIPVYNEEGLLYANTKRLFDFLDSINARDYEVIIIDNGSTDRTPKFGSVLENEYQNLRFLSLKERGVGNAFKKGILTSKYENIISLDMDLSIDLNFIPKAIDLLKENSVIIGSKKTGNQRRSFFRKIPSSVFIFLTKLLLGLSYNDYSMAAKAYRKNDLLGCIGRIDHGSSYVIEIINYNHRTKNKIKEIPVNCFDNRKSRFNLVNEVFYRGKNLIKLFLKNLVT